MIINKKIKHNAIRMVTDIKDNIKNIQKIEIKYFIMRQVISKKNLENYYREVYVIYYNSFNV